MFIFNVVYTFHKEKKKHARDMKIISKKLPPEVAVQESITLFIEDK